MLFWFCVLGRRLSSFLRFVWVSGFVFRGYGAREGSQISGLAQVLAAVRFSSTGRRPDPQTGFSVSQTLDPKP